MKIWSLPKHENLTTGKKYCGKEEKLLLRSNFSSFPQYFQYISDFNSSITHIYLLNVVVRIIFSSILQIWYVELRISRSISEGPLEFEITRVDCILEESIFDCRHVRLYYVYIPIKNGWTICKQWRPYSDSAFCGIWSGSALFASYTIRSLKSSMVSKNNTGLKHFCTRLIETRTLWWLSV